MVLVSAKILNDLLLDFAHVFASPPFIVYVTNAALYWVFKTGAVVFAIIYYKPTNESFLFIMFYCVEKIKYKIATSCIYKTAHNRIAWFKIGKKVEETEE